MFSKSFRVIGVLFVVVLGASANSYAFSYKMSLVEKDLVELSDRYGVTIDSHSVDKILELDRSKKTKRVRYRGKDSELTPLEYVMFKLNPDTLFFILDKLVNEKAKEFGKDQDYLLSRVTYLNERLENFKANHAIYNYYVSLHFTRDWANLCLNIIDREKVKNVVRNYDEVSMLFLFNKTHLQVKKRVRSEKFLEEVLKDAMSKYVSGEDKQYLDHFFQFFSKRSKSNSKIIDLDTDIDVIYSKLLDTSDRREAMSQFTQKWNVNVQNSSVSSAAVSRSSDTARVTEGTTDREDSRKRNREEKESDRSSDSRPSDRDVKRSRTMEDEKNSSLTKDSGLTDVSQSQSRSSTSSTTHSVATSTSTSSSTASLPPSVASAAPLVSHNLSSLLKLIHAPKISDDCLIGLVKRSKLPEVCKVNGKEIPTVLYILNQRPSALNGVLAANLIPHAGTACEGSYTKVRDQMLTELFLNGSWDQLSTFINSENFIDKKSKQSLLDAFIMTAAVEGRSDLIIQLFERKIVDDSEKSRLSQFLFEFCNRNGNEALLTTFVEKGIIDLDE